MADGDYERGRGREIASVAAELRRLAAVCASGEFNGQDARCPSASRVNGQDARAGVSQTEVFVLNGWAASPHAWDLCRFMRPCDRLGEATESVAATSTALPCGRLGEATLPRLFSYVEQLDGEPEKAMEGVERCVLVGWSMGGSSVLRLAARWPEKVAGLVLITATPRMMEEKESGWKGMSPLRL